MESLPQRPAGGRAGDFDGIGDGVLLEIASSPDTASEDAENAQAEISRREMKGTFDYDALPQDLSRKFFGNGYGIENGKILYPTSEYKTWLRSDRSTPPPKGRVRETMQDRINRTKDREDRNRFAGEAALTFADPEASTSQKIPKSSGEKAPKSTQRAIEKKRSQQRTVRRKTKEGFKNAFYNSKDFDYPSDQEYYDNIPSDARLTEEQKVEQEAEQMANIPIYKLPDDKREFHRYSFESPSDRAEKLYAGFERNFTRVAPRWISFGVTSLLEKRVLEFTAESLLKNGFLAREEDRVRQGIDPKNSFSENAINAENDLKNRVVNNLIPERVQEIPSEELFRAKRDGFRYAICSGARVDGKNGKIIYSLPFKYSRRAYSVMVESGINPLSEKDRQLSYSGFIGVLEAIKDNTKATRNGFKALDWYYDSFLYRRHESEFADVMDTYREDADAAFGDTLDAYLSYKKQKLPSAREAELLGLSDAKEVTREGLSEFLESLGGDSQSGENVGLFQQPNERDVSFLPDVGDRNWQVIDRILVKYPTAEEKRAKAAAEIKKIAELDPHMNYYYGATFNPNEASDREGSTTHIVVRFGHNGFNNVIAIPVDDKSRAMYCWRGKTGDDREGWRKFFNGSSRSRDESVGRFVCHGYSKIGSEALDKEWERVWNYLNRPEDES